MLSGLVSPAFAQFSKLADLADQFSREFKRANAKVAVAEEFTAQDARRSGPGESITKPMKIQRLWEMRSFVPDDLLILSAV